MTRKIFLRIALVVSMLMLLTLPSLTNINAMAQSSKPAADFCEDEFFSCLQAGRPGDECLAEYLACIGGSK